MVKKMVIRYLEKLCEEYNKEKFHIDRQCESLQLRLKETTELMKLFEETSDPNYESFTPREVDTKKKRQYLKLQEEKKNIQSALDQQREASEDWKKKIDELTEILLEEKRKASEEERKELEYEKIAEDLAGLLHRLDLCYKLAEVDVARCRMELHILTESIQNMIETYLQNQ